MFTKVIIEVVLVMACRVGLVTGLLIPFYGLKVETHTNSDLRIQSVDLDNIFNPQSG